MKYGNQRIIQVSEASKGMSVALPIKKFVGSKNSVAYDLIEWMMSEGTINRTQLFGLIMLKELNTLNEGNGNKEIVISINNKNEENQDA